MSVPSHSVSISCRLLLLFCLVLPATSLLADQFEEDVSTEQCLYAKGIIQSISPEQLTITLKQKEGPKIRLSIDKDTIFEGFYELKELKRRQKLKVWYQPGEQENKALKITKPLDLGC